MRAFERKIDNINLIIAEISLTAVTLFVITLPTDSIQEYNLYNNEIKGIFIGISFKSFRHGHEFHSNVIKYDHCISGMFTNKLNFNGIVSIMSFSYFLESFF